ncbi:glycoside hydrolase family 13 protein [Microbulbifer hydrolyticus]|uniref:Alpha-amylase n=1 Tax=Microbulbifer hydrolyticus TaxID=48074 RepID=A0A6P1TG52_9GAMM|nr:glycoside hydrolase family 13 protein [Microbulbifer hydrolyticus]MBB5211896.1 glycosidase [Microbulbifer hydrolyticus]QHQ40520.1 alpha-amylase [Microbulbifer hydrolyticus]
MPPARILPFFRQSGPVNAVAQSGLIIALALSATANALCPAQSDATPLEPIQLNARGEFVPEWGKSAIWYQIFPERFRNGDPENDPRVTDIKGSDPQEPVAHWQVHPWGSDWYELQDYEKKNGDKELWKHLLRRRYGGDLQGIIDQLDYLQDLGINAIYLNPVFDSPSLHKYDGASYHHIDPTFGPDPEGDRRLMAKENPLDPATWVWTKADELALRLIRQAHARGMRIIFDGVFNHMGINSFAFQDLKKNQQASPYKDWFTVTSWDDEEAGTKFDYEGWFGVKSLPEFAEDINGLAEGPRDYVFAATERWMNPKGQGSEHGIDGWRLDVAFCVGHRFWKQWRQHVKSINPEAYLTAEIVDTPDKVKPYLQGDEFDGEMNYNFAFTSAEFFFHPEASRISASEFDHELARLRNLYPKGVAYVTQNLFGSHDSNRIGSHIVNRGIGSFRDWGTYFNLSQAAGNTGYQVRKPNRAERQLQKLFAIFQMTYVGAPMIYYGDEVGMWGANDPDDRKPMVWSDIEYADEVFNPDGSKRSPDSVEVNEELRAHYKKMINIRNQHAALRIGNYRTIMADDAKQIFVFEREHNGQHLWVLLNSGEQAQNIQLKDSTLNEVAVDLLTGERFEPRSGELKVSVSEKWGRVLLLNK